MAELEKPVIPGGAAAGGAPGKKDDKPGQTPAPAEAAKKKKKKISWKVILFALAGLFVIGALVAAALFAPKSGNNKDKNKFGPTPTTAPRPTIPEQTLGEPTVYSNDPQILQLEGALKNFERQLDSVDLRETDLDPPVLLMNVNFGDAVSTR